MKILKRIFERRRRRGSRTQIVVTAILFLLLPLLAALQYHWLGQLSEGERERMQAGLGSAATRFSQDFNREIARAGIPFMLPPNLQSDEKLAALVEGYDRWREAASYPSLIKAVFVARPPTGLDAGGQLDLTQLKPDTRRFEPSAWPDRMNELRHRIEQHLAAPPRPLDELPDMPAAPERARRSHQMPILNGDIPALVIPILQVPPILDRREFVRLRSWRPWGYALIELDLHCLQQEILPSLAQRHFAEGGHLSYELVITRQSDRRQIVYRSGSESSLHGQGWDYGKDDARIGLFGFGTDELRTMFKDRIRTWDIFRPALGADLRRDEKRSGMAGRLRRSGLMAGPPPITRLGLRLAEQSELWELHIRHRAGSLEAAVSRARWRNLFISSSILAVLAASMALLIISAQRARRLAQQQMDFVAGVSHELRTPIAVIDAAGYNIARGVMKNQEQIKKYGLLIRKETGQLKEIVEQVLEFSGMQSGYGRYDLLPTDVNQVIEDLLASSQPLFDEGHFQVEKSIAPDLPPVMADSRALSRAIQNLLNNAMKYGSESRWIGLRAEAAIFEQVPQIRITVSDRGLGIPPEEQLHIFEPFYRGKEARIAQIRGSGLGLSLVKNIIEEHGGSISVQSRPGEGSSFTLNLPAVMPIGDRSPAAGCQLKTERMQAGIEI